MSHPVPAWDTDVLLSAARKFLVSRCGATLRLAIQSPAERQQWLDDEAAELADALTDVADERAAELRESLMRSMKEAPLADDDAEGLAA